jgi:serine/threonine protein kinase
LAETSADGAEMGGLDDVELELPDSPGPSAPVAAPPGVTPVRVPPPSALAGASGSAPPSAPPSTATPPPKTNSQSGPDPLIGRVVNDRFRIVSMLARGGMGKVYRAEQAPLGREVALKVLNPNYSGENDPEFHKRFFLEASTCSKLTHPNTVTIFDYGRTDDDVYYIAMELLEGRTLHRALRDEGPFSPERAMHIMRQMCRSLREAHGLGVIHRDLKPANVYLVKHGDEGDFVKVLDFGLVKNVDDGGEDLTQTGLFMGSPKYMSPEQIRGERADARADIYSLGVMLFEMLTGKVPFDRPNSVNILMAHVHEPPPTFQETNPSLQLPAGIEALVMKALSKQPDDRYASMDELLAAMKQLHNSGELRSGDLGLSAEHPNPVYGTGSFKALRQSGDHPASLTPSGVIAAGGLGQTSSRPSSPTKSGSTATTTGPSPASTSLPPVSSPDAMPAPASRAPLYAGIGIGALLILGLVGYASMGTSTGASTTTTADTHPTPVEPDRIVPPVVPPPVTPTIVHTVVSLRSTPTGATVEVGDHTYGPTPTDVEWTGDDAARGREVSFVFHLAGHRDYTVLRTVTSDALEVQASLEALPTDRPFRPRPPRHPEGDDPSSPVGPVKGYKLDPY